MNQRQDQDWDKMLERIDLEISAADLAAAEQQLRDLEQSGLPAADPEWVETMVAMATAPAASDAEPVAAPVVQRMWWQDVQRFVAAALATLGIHSTAAAMTVTGVAVVGVVAVSMLWPSMQNSRETMSHSMAREILMDPHEPLDARLAALHELVRHLGNGITCLRDLPGEDAPTGDLASASTDELGVLAQLLDGTAAADHPSPNSSDLAVGLAAANDRSLAEASRLSGMRVVAEACKRDIVLLRRLPAPQPELAAARDKILRGLQKLAAGRR